MVAIVTVVAIEQLVKGCNGQNQFTFSSEG